MNPIPRASLCGCVVNVSSEQLSQLLQYPEVDLLEWRLDAFLQVHSLEDTLEALSILSTSPRHPVLATNRPRREGGAFDGPEKRRIEVLEKAVESGAEWVDIEADVPLKTLERFQAGKARVVLSHHDFSGTPDASSLKRLAKKMARRKPQIVKIITYARTPEDNLRVLDLIPFGRQELGADLIAFCMGPYGGWSRLACLALGSPWMYVQLPGLEPSAPGQYTAEEMRRLLEAGRWLPHP